MDTLVNRRLCSMTRFWQGLLLIGIVYMIISITTLLTEKPYDFDYKLIRPSQPYKQLIWDINYRGA